MALRTFSNKTLNGNWYEDRWAPPQASQMYPEDRSVRTHETAISTINASGLPQPLEVIKRLPKWNTTGVIPDDGYREDYTINQTEIPNPAVVRSQLQQRPPLVDQSTGHTKPLLTQQNIAELTHVKRETQAPESGFGAVLPRHHPDHARRYFVTTAQHYFGKTETETRAEKPKTVTEGGFYQTTNQAFYQSGGLPKQQAAGTTVRAGYMSLKEGTKMDLLAGEPWRRHPDPQHNTKVQRTWLYSEDPGVNAREKGALPGLSDQDNELSLPLGRGDYNKRTLSMEPGAYRRMRQDVTMNPDQYVQLGFRGSLA